MTWNKKPTIFACIPALNEQATITPILINVSKFVDEIYVCDDGSADITAELAISFGAHLIRHQSNLGKGAALKSLFKAIEPFNPDIIVVLDADGQHNPQDIPKIIEPILKREADFVIGSRFIDGSSLNAPFYRRFGLHIINGLILSSIKDTQSGLRAFSRKALEVVTKAESNGFGVETEQISLAKKCGLKIVEVPVKMLYGGALITSKKNPISHGFEILYTIFRLSIKDNPSFTLGVFASTMFGASIISGYYLLLYYNTDGIISITLGLLFFINFTLGILLGISALFLQSMQRLTLKIGEIVHSLNTSEKKKVEEPV